MRKGETGMNENADHQILMQKINKWFNLTSTVQVIFTIGLFIIFPLSSIISLILLILMGKKTKITARINIIWHCFILFGYFIIKKIQEFLMDNEGLTYLRLLGRGRDFFAGFFSGYIGLILIVDAALILICIRAYMYAIDNENLKKLDGYPYFYERNSYAHLYTVNHSVSASQQKGLSEKESENTDYNAEKSSIPTEPSVDTAEFSKNVNMENDSRGNSEVVRCFKEMVLDIKNSIFKKPENFIDYTKITAIIIIMLGFLNLHPSSILFSMLEFVFLIIALVYPNSRRIMTGFIMHGTGCLFMILAGNLKTNGVVFAFLIMLNIFQTVLYYFAYRDSIQMEDMRREEIKIKYEEKKEEREYHPENNFDIYRSEPENIIENIEENKKISLVKKERIAMDEIRIPENIIPDSIHQKPDLMDKADI